jgi:hypothetical protein
LLFIEPTEVAGSQIQDSFHGRDTWEAVAGIILISEALMGIFSIDYQILVVQSWEHVNELVMGIVPGLLVTVEQDEAVVVPDVDVAVVRPSDGQSILILINTVERNEGMRSGVEEESIELLAVDGDSWLATAPDTAPRLVREIVVPGVCEALESHVTLLRPDRAIDGVRDQLTDTMGKDLRQGLIPRGVGVGFCFGIELVAISHLSNPINKDKGKDVIWVTDLGKTKGWTSKRIGLFLRNLLDTVRLPRAMVDQC